MNALAAKVKEAIDSQKDLEEAANKVPSEARTKFVDSLNAVAPKVEALAAKYKELAADPAVKAALDKVSARGNPKLAAGPSPDFTKAIDEVATWRSQLDSEAIPLRESHGVYTVEAILNGGEPLRLLVDTGASHVTLPFEVAEKLNLTPGENDATVQMKLANGAIIEGKLMTLKSVRVGRFTAANVSCVVLQQGLPDPPIILGTSFLNRFVVKLSQSARELYLTEVGEGGKSESK
jgi:aspartyl protease family protein